MNRLTFRSMALAGALVSPAVSYAQISCTREGLQTASDQYIAVQTQGNVRPRLAPSPLFESAVGPRTLLGDLPVSGSVSYVENFDTVHPGHLISKPLKIDQHLSLLDTARCETFTEGLVSDKASPYAFGTRLHVSRGVVTEIETMWSTTGYRGFDIDSYLKNSSAEDWGHYSRSQTGHARDAGVHRECLLGCAPGWKGGCDAVGLPLRSHRGGWFLPGQRTEGHC